MYAIFETGGRQYRVSPGQTVEVEKLDVLVGESITFDRVLLVADDEAVKVGQPVVAGAMIRAKVTGQLRYRKVTIFRYMAKERIRHKTGHRQPFTRLRIEAIEA